MSSSSSLNEGMETIIGVSQESRQVLSSHLYGQTVTPQMQGELSTSFDHTAGRDQRKWDLRFLSLAELVASWSKDPSTKVGAVITYGNRIISLGYNGFPSYCPDDNDLLCDRMVKNLMVVHAEANAILYAEGRCFAGTIYVTHPPCSACAALIIQAGIMEVVARGSDRMEGDPTWADRIEVAKKMFKSAKVEYRRVD